MVTKERTKIDPGNFVEEVKALILRGFPDAEFDVYKVDPKEYRIDVYGDFDDMFDILELTSDRVVDILVDHDIYIGVSPLGPRRRDD